MGKEINEIEMELWRLKWIICFLRLFFFLHKFAVRIDFRDILFIASKDELNHQSSINSQLKSFKLKFVVSPLAFSFIVHPFGFNYLYNFTCTTCVTHFFHSL